MSAEFTVKTFCFGPLQTNCYLLTVTDEESGKVKGIVIDPGMNPQKLIDYVKDIEIEAILLTHAHFDHMAGVDEVRKVTKAPVYIHDLEADWLTDAKKNGSVRWSDVTPPLSTDAAEYALDEGQTLKLIGHEFKVYHTPGHSPGSVSFLCKEHLFSGDVLFNRSIGRTDLPGGRELDLIYSLQQKLYRLPDETIVYPGHGPRTKIGFEKEFNHFVKAL